MYTRRQLDDRYKNERLLPESLLKDPNRLFDPSTVPLVPLVVLYLFTTPRLQVGDQKVFLQWVTVMDTTVISA